MEKLKLCLGCGQEKPTTEFGRDKRQLDGLQGRCRACDSQTKTAKYYKLKRDPIAYSEYLEKRRVHMKEREDIRKRQRQCVACKQPAEIGITRCAYHQERLKEIRRQRDLRRLEARLCMKCGKEPQAQGYTWCSRCRHEGREARYESVNKYRKSDKGIAARKRRFREIRDECYAAYGKVCVCCGEAEPLFLSIDHVNNDGAIHRREIFGHRTGVIYRWLKRNKFPAGFQVLCMNCNHGKMRNGGICPHKQNA